MFNLADRDSTLQKMESAMHIASMRHNVIASNIANNETPGYKAMDIAFRDELQGAVKRIENADQGGFLDKITYSAMRKPSVFEVEGLTPRQDGNTVNIDSEFGKLSKTTSLYKQAITIYGTKVRMLKSALQSDTVV